MNYDNTIKFWDNIFSKSTLKKLNQPLPYPEIEKSIEWISKNSQSIIDYGCGNGTLLIRSYFYGVEQGLGIDISSNAVDSANKLIEKNNIDGFIVEKGNHLKLQDIQSNMFESAILSNVIDNVLPEDGEFIIKEINRILAPDGKIFIKLNDFIEKQDIKNDRDRFEEELQTDFYIEPSGLYLHNFSDEKFEKLIKPFFEIKDKFYIEFEEFDQKNRIWLLKNKKS